MPKCIKSLTGLSCFIFVICISVASVGKIVVYSFEEKCLNSDVIGIGTVTDIRKSLFSYDKAYIRVDTVIKGRLVTQDVVVLYGNLFFTAKEDLTKFIIGGKYLVFLIAEGTTYWLVAAHDGYYRISNDNTIHLKGRRVPIESFIFKVKEVLK